MRRIIITFTHTNKHTRRTDNYFCFPLLLFRCFFFSPAREFLSAYKNSHKRANSRHFSTLSVDTMLPRTRLKLEWRPQWMNERANATHSSRFSLWIQLEFVFAVVVLGMFALVGIWGMQNLFGVCTIFRTICITIRYLDRVDKISIYIKV